MTYMFCANMSLPFCQCPWMSLEAWAEKPQLGQPHFLKSAGFPSFGDKGDSVLRPSFYFAGCP